MIIIRSMMKTKMKMRNIKTVIFLLTVFGANCLDALEENARTASTATTFSTSLAPTLGVTNSSIQLIDKKIDIALTKAEHKNTEEPGFISKISNLIFGSTGDSTPAETQSVVQYGPPPGPNYGNGGNNGHQGHGRPQNQADCNPCNKEPWVPIMRNYAHQHHHQAQYQGPQQNLQYGPPHIQPPIHNAQPFLQNNFGHSGPDIGIQHLPLENYGPPTFNNYQGPQHIEDNYGAHDFSGPVHPPNNYGPPVHPLKGYGVPPAPPQQQQLPILQSPDYGPPLVNFGPPKPLKEFNPPPIAELHSPPLPSLSSHFGNHYGPPKPLYKIPNKNHGPLINQPDFNNHHKPIHNAGKSPRQIRPGFGRPGPKNHYGPPSPQPVYKYIPIHKGKMQNLPTNFEPPPPPPHYNGGGPIYNSYQKPIHQNIQVPQTHIQRPPGDIKTHITNPEYLPPPQQLPIASGHNAEPLPLPNLSLTPIAPLHNPQNFHDNFPQPGSKIEIPYESNVQIQQSIPLVDYLATIEHPINIIRSPILDVNVANSTTQSDGYYIQSAPPVQSPPPSLPSIPQGPQIQVHQQEPPKPVQPPNNFEPTYRPSEYGNYDEYKLSENPIVVEDTHTAAATNANKTVSNYNNLQSSEELNAGFINQILSNINGIHDDEIQVPKASSSQQTPSPSTSMQPPPIGESPWMASINPGRLIDSTTKKPKQIQIIIPYTTNNNNPTNNQRQQNRLSNEHKIQNTHATHQHSNNQQQIPLKEEMIQESASHEIPTSTKQPTNVINIKEFFKQNPVASNFNNLPFDVIRLQKNIDGWTEQEYSKNIVPEKIKSPPFTSLTPSLASSHATTAITKFVTSKRIPDEYLTTLPYYSTEIKTKSSVTTPIPSTPSNHAQFYQDHEPAGSNSKEYLDSNLVATTEPSTTPKYNKLQSWDKIHIAVSPYTKEKIYVVTPQPKSASTSGWRQSRDNNKNENSIANNSSSTFSISIMAMKNKTNDSKDVRVVLSEWPHLINNLATTLHTQSSSTTTTLPPPTTRNSSPHPLFGLMDLSSYTPPANSTIETYSGHSKVINVATASLRKHSVADENKTTPRSTTTTTTTLK